MKFSTREDIAAPIADVFEALMDFETYERAALRRGVDVMRVDDIPGKGVGQTWQADFKFRGRRRKLTAKITDYEAPQIAVVESQSDGLQGTVTIELVALSANDTRLFLQFEMRPKSFTARVFIQSLRLSKAALSRRFKNSVTNYARGLEHQLQNH